jgi:hypothetical protein
MKAGEDDVGGDPDRQEATKRGIVGPLLFRDEDTQRCDAENDLKVAEQTEE